MALMHGDARLITPAVAAISGGGLIAYVGAAAERPSGTPEGFRLLRDPGTPGSVGFTFGRGDGLAADLYAIVSLFGMSVSPVRSPLHCILRPLSEPG